MEVDLVVSLGKHLATEKWTLDRCIQNYPYSEARTKACVTLIRQVVNLDYNSRILEIGAGQGSLLIALRRLGYTCEGIEPSQEAIEVSRGLSAALNTSINITKGYAERLPYGDSQFDCVIALSVMEHVRNAEAVFKEVFRVTKPGGLFYFSTTNSLCPHQHEIRFSPFFSWYPDGLKVKIMEWAKRHWPSIIGYTDAPAINWFTPWKATRMLKTAGFARVYDKWDIIMPRISPYVRQPYLRLAIRVIRLNTVTRRIADILLPLDLHCVAVKQ